MYSSDYLNYGVINYICEKLNDKADDFLNVNFNTIIEEDPHLSSEEKANEDKTTVTEWVLNQMQNRQED